MGLVFVLTKHRRQLVVTVALPLVIVFALAWSLNLQVPAQPRPISVTQLVANVTSLKGGGSQGSTQLAENVQFRDELWTSLIKETVQRHKLVSGWGFGPNLALEVGFEGDLANPLRSPHNSHLDILARMGIVGTVLWGTLWASWYGSLLFERFRLRRRGRRFTAGVLDFAMVGTTLILVNAYFDPSLEGAQVAVWLWTFFGLGLGLVALERIRVPAPPPPVAGCSPGPSPRRRSPTFPPRMVTALLEEPARHVEVGGGNRLRGERVEPGATGLDQPRFAARVVVQDPGQRGGHGRRIINRHEQTGPPTVDGEGRARRAISRDNRDVDGHGLEDHHGQPLGVGGQREGVGLGDAGQRVRPEPGEPHIVGELLFGDELLEPVDERVRHRSAPTRVSRTSPDDSRRSGRARTSVSWPLRAMRLPTEHTIRGRGSASQG